MKTYNILILCVGRRVELVQAFRKASCDLKIESQIIGADSVKLAPALYYCDQHVILPRIEDPDYLPAIIQICQNNQIALIVPTIDTDLLLLSENRERIEAESGAKVLVSDYETIKICRDKIMTQIFMEKNGFKMPKRYSDEEMDHGKLVFPLFAKPKSGSSSINTMKIENADQLKAYRTLVKDAVVQDYADGLYMLVTSAGKQEGKSTTIANLAIAFAQSNQKVLLIDCDLRQPKQGVIFGINKMKTGLTNLMVDQLPVDTAINGIPNLSLDVMVAGSKKVSAAELLNSEDFEEMIKSFRKIYDLILIDTPPVLSFADASIISKVVDGVVLVVASGETKKAMVVESKKNLDKVGANLVGVILTKMKFNRNPEYYRYDYKKRKRRFL